MPQTMPKKWSRAELAADVQLSMDLFAQARVHEPEQLYLNLFSENYARVRKVLTITKDLTKLTECMPKLLEDGYFDVVRYLTAPPISEDDMVTVAGLSSKAASNLKLPDNTSKVNAFVTATLDKKRFAWWWEKRKPDEHERRTAMVATAALMATQRVQTQRRTLAKQNQEGGVKKFLTEQLHYSEVDRREITTAFDAPKAFEFCGETPVAGKKADIVVGLGDHRFLCLECKVSNSAVNSFKRVNHETVEKTVHWYSAFGVNGVVCAGVLSGVFKVDNLVDAQSTNTYLFWSHDLEPLGEFIASTFETPDILSSSQQVAVEYMGQD